MAEVEKYINYKGHVIRHVFKGGRWCYDTTASLILWDTLAEAKKAIDDYLARKEAVK